jgi:hypothetical protein
VGETVVKDFPATLYDMTKWPSLKHFSDEVGPANAAAYRPFRTPLSATSFSGSGCRFWLGYAVYGEVPMLPSHLLGPVVGASDGALSARLLV